MRSVRRKKAEVLKGLLVIEPRSNRSASTEVGADPQEEHEINRMRVLLEAAFDQVADDPDVQGFGESGQNGAPLPAIPEMGSVWTAWTDAYELIYDQQGTPTENFQAAADQIRNLIAEG